jgi:hypothetical protein
MPAIGRQAVASARGFGAFTVLSGPFWIGAITQTSTTFVTRSVTVDSVGNVIVTGNILGTPNYAQIIKISPAGSLVWQKKMLLSATGDITFDCACLNLSGGSYDYTFVTTTNGSGYNLLFRVDSDGTLNYQKNYGSGLYGMRINSIPSNITQVVGQYQPSTYLEGVYLTYTLSNGTLFYQNKIYSGSKNIALTGVPNTGQATYPIVGYAGNNLLLISAVGNGNLYWQRELAPASGAVSWADIAQDVNGFAYIVATSTSEIQIVRYDPNTSTPSLSWQRNIAATPSFRFRIAVDAQKNSYCVGTLNTGNTLILKYDVNGTLVWQRSITNASAYDIAVYNDTMYITAQATVSGNTSIIVFKLPTAGGLLGTYTVAGTSFTYSSSSFVDSAGTWTESTPAYSTTTLSLGDYAGSGSYNDNGATLTKTNI